MKLEIVKEIVTVKQVVYEKEVEYRTQIVSSESAKQVGIREIGDEAQEVLLVVALNSNNEINAIHRAFKGTLDQSVAHPREIFRTAILNNARRIMIFHNHPSANLTPSPADLHITEILVKAGEILGIELLDHIIVSGENAYSLKENGDL